MRIRQAGSVLFFTLILSGVLVVTLGGYLWWVRSQNLLVVESQAWNCALVAAEAGIEEGLAQINTSFGTNYMDSLRANWSSQGNGTYGPRTGLLTNGSSYQAVILPGSPGPSIVSTGSSIAPVISKPISRIVQVTTAAVPGWEFGLGTALGISCGGHNMSIDSYDSTDPLHSTGGRYDPLKRKAGGDVACPLGLTNVLSRALVNGRLFTGAEARPGLGLNGLVGDLSFSGPGIQPGWYANDFNREFRPAQAPDSIGFVPPMGDATNTYVLSEGGYVLSGDLLLDTAQTMLVKGNAILFVRGAVRMAGASGGNLVGSAAINIAPNCSLRMYVAGETANLAQINTAGGALSFQYFGLPSNQVVAWDGGDSYVGTIYAPQARLTLGSRVPINHALEFEGACVANSISLINRFKFHYDEALKKIGPMQGFVVTSWREL
jgi:hypothetical protein